MHVVVVVELVQSAVVVLHANLTLPDWAHDVLTPGPAVVSQNGLLFGLPIVLDSDSEDIQPGDKVLLRWGYIQG